ncbi:MAG: hypothetical protein HOH33_00315 [Verrucomicrobia bacterium]|jgi:surface-anchored protein|nr:hypothetical protein [Verrucomicrobiota bacterium]
MKFLTQYSAMYYMGLIAGILFQLEIEADRSFVWQEGHGDLEVSYIDGEWHWTMEAGRAPETVALGLGSAALNLVPDLPDFEFLGTPGSPVWIIPQSAQPGIPFMGIASDTPSGTFVDNQVQLQLKTVDGPGDVFSWSAGGAAVEVDIDSSNGLDASDQILVPAPGHLHRNIGFTAPGTYRLEFIASGRRSVAEEPIQSSPVTIHVKVAVIEHGEVDLELLYDADGWELELFDEETEMEMEPSLVAFRLNEHSLQAMPSGLGTFDPATPPPHLYVMPANQHPELPFLGVATDELTSSTFADDNVALNLAEIQGPGDVFLFGVNPFGAMEIFFDTSNGIDLEDTLPLQTGQHVHYHLGFTEPGRYKLHLQAGGILASNSTLIASKPFEFYFEVPNLTPFSEGKVDLDLGYQDDLWTLNIVDESTEEALCLSDAFLIIHPMHSTSLPTDTALASFASTVIQAVVLPQQEQEDLPFLGLGTESLEAGLFENNEITLQIADVDGPGQVAIFSLDPFGKVELHVDSSNGLNEDDSINLESGNDTHMNWAFSTPGIYRIIFQITGTPSGKSQGVKSLPQTLIFDVKASVITSAHPSFEMSIVGLGNGDFNIGWKSETGHSYQLQSKPDLNAPEWENVGDSVDGTGDTIEQTIQSTNQQHAFFRLISQPSEN